MTRLFYDGINTDAGRIPVTAQGVFVYVDGLYRWSESDIARFKNSVIVGTAVFASTNDGDELDVERGDATPGEAPGWVLMRRKAGKRAPGVYMNADTWPAVKSAFMAQDVAEPLYRVAQYDGKAVIPAGAFGKQYASFDAYDLSVMGDYWPGVDPDPVIGEMEDGMEIRTVEGSPEVWGLSGGRYWHIADIGALSAYRAKGVPEFHVSAAEHASILAAGAQQVSVSGGPKGATFTY